ncbi:DUF5082 domain-containing protein [Staphylococcus simulans]|uniref:YwqH-like family protein n=1 Tax=Staphylococcus simulans TaxID=1286 RepID=UPI000D09F441|nr:DUF5082 family protein [Staphylococcus simulans]AVO03096.1 DUF5082 domain-containing protein [Staphylococcus simulans]AVO06051.1 DUF5082 domain-containing protein [Staphylococcus simulans]AWG19644.1 DUF5082 domain-containing protein [Staphylococcus simulans]AWI02593.1 DUF5082 domain-containing protein [Staphylococcus simulans]
MSNKSHLRAMKTKYIGIRNDKKSELNDLQADKKRLKEAIDKAVNIEEEFNSEKSRYDGIEIQNNEWKGETRNKSNQKKQNLDEAIQNYKSKYEEIIDQMKNDLEELEAKIQGVETDISELSSRISSLESQLASD